MQFLIKAYDGEGKLDRRMEVRPRHLEGMKELSGHIICAGGLLDDEGKMKGSALIRHAYNDFDSAERVKTEEYHADVEEGRVSINLPPCSVVEVRMSEGV